VKSLNSLDSTKLAIGGLAFAGVLVAVVGYLMVISPQGKKASSLDTEIATKQAQLDALHGPGATNKPSLHASELFQLARAMPNTDDQPGILLELSRLANASNVTLVAVSFQPRVAQTDGSSALPVGLTVDGSWAHFATFVRLVGNEVRTKGSSFSIGGRLFVVDSIQITPNKNIPGTIEAILTMSAFDYGAPPSPTATAGAATSTTTTGTTTTTATTSGSQQAAGTSGSGS
jgi:Tfp pilus assembly protein PilO